MKQTYNSAESGALNILQNCSLLRIKPKSGPDFISSSLLQNLSAGDVAYDLYCYINEIKLNKGFIDEKQYKDNELVGLNRAIKSPLGF